MGKLEGMIAYDALEALRLDGHERPLFQMRYPHTIAFTLDFLAQSVWLAGDEQPSWWRVTYCPPNGFFSTYRLYPDGKWTGDDELLAKLLGACKYRIECYSLPTCEMSSNEVARRYIGAQASPF